MKLPPRLAVLLLIFLLASMPGLIGQAPPSAGGAPEPAAALVRNGPTVHAVSINFDSGKILEPARMVSDGDFHRQPDWSFDGKYLSYVNNNPQQRRSIKILSMDSGEVREIVPTMDFFEWPRWSPDGRSFIIHDGTGTIQQVDVQTGQSAVVIPRDPSMLRYFPQWMPDGRRIVFGRSELDKAGKEINETIVEFDLQSGKERDLFRGEMDPRSLSVSPDGQFLAGIHIDIVRKQSSLLLIPIPAGQPVRELLRLDQFGGQFTTWTPNGASLLFTKDNQDIQAIETWIVSLATGQKKLIDLGGYVGHRGVRVQPGGEQLVFWLPAVAQVRAMENSPPAPAANK